jgi:hypothetical protein
MPASASSNAAVHPAIPAPIIKTLALFFSSIVFLRNFLQFTLSSPKINLFSDRLAVNPAGGVVKYFIIV